MRVSLLFVFGGSTSSTQVEGTYRFSKPGLLRVFEKSKPGTKGAIEAGVLLLSLIFHEIEKKTAPVPPQPPLLSRTPIAHGTLLHLLERDRGNYRGSPHLRKSGKVGRYLYLLKK